MCSTLGVLLTPYRDPPSDRGLFNQRTKLPSDPKMPDDDALQIEILKAAYAAFNARDIDAALATMSGDVRWPQAFKGGFVQGHQAVREYWTHQWSEIDPHVAPVSFDREPDGRVLVDVHQVVRDLAGKVLADVQVGHRFTLANGLIAAMQVCSLL